MFEPQNYTKDYWVPDFSTQYYPVLFENIELESTAGS